MRSQKEGRDVLSFTIFNSNYILIFFFQFLNLKAKHHFYNIILANRVFQD